MAPQPPVCAGRHDEGDRMMVGASKAEAELREWRKKAHDGALHQLLWHEVTACLRSEDLDLIGNAWAAVREFEAQQILLAGDFA